MAEQKARIQLVEGSESREPLCAQHANGLMMTSDQSMHLASQLKALCEQAVGADAGAGVGGRSEMSLRGMRDISMSIRGRGAGNGAGGDSSGVGSGGMMVEISAHGPRVLDRALERATGGLIEVLNRGGGVELWCENRYASLERYIAFLVVFHQMVASVAAFTPLAFDISRSQSQLRVATTAAPISAAELEKEWAADNAGSKLAAFHHEVQPDPTVHRGGRATAAGQVSGSA